MLVTWVWKSFDRRVCRDGHGAGITLVAVGIESHIDGRLLRAYHGVRNADGAAAKLPEPKSAWIPIVPPMKLMRAVELGSTAAEEIFWFQGLLAGKGTKPLRLAPPRRRSCRCRRWPAWFR